MARTDPQYRLRLPAALHTLIHDTSLHSHRTMNAEIVARLEASFEEAPVRRMGPIPSPAPGESVVTIELPLSIAQRISNGLSDLALWCHGFNAALGADENSRRPWGTDAVTDINLRLKGAMREPF